MEPAIRAEFTDDVHARIARAVGVEAQALVKLGGFESYVHETIVAGRPRIVRSTWHARRSREQLGAELHFIGALADAGVPACRALPLFLDLREHTLRAVIVRSLLPEERSEFWSRYLADAEARILAGAPALGLQA